MCMPVASPVYDRMCCVHSVSLQSCVVPDGAGSHNPFTAPKLSVGLKLRLALTWDGSGLHKCFLCSYIPHTTLEPPRQHLHTPDFLLQVCRYVCMYVLGSDGMYVLDAEVS